MERITNLYARDYLIKRCLFKTSKGDSWNLLKLHPEDNVLLLDADKFLISDSLKYIEEETIKIDPTLSHENYLSITDAIRQITAEINRIAGENIADYAVECTGDTWYYIKGEGENRIYLPLNDFRLAGLFKQKKSYERQLRDYFIRKDFILEEVEENGKRLDYTYIYNNSHVDERACSMANICAMDGSYAYVMVVSYSNSHETESKEKDKKLSGVLGPEIKRLYIPYHLAPFYINSDDGKVGGVTRDAANKPLVVENIFGKFNSALSTFHDDSGAACAMAQASYPEMDCIRLVDGGSAADNIRMGRERVLTKKSI